jgi:hypothetical protein
MNKNSILKEGFMKRYESTWVSQLNLATQVIRT